MVFLRNAYCVEGSETTGRLAQRELMLERIQKSLSSYAVDPSVIQPVFGHRR